MTEGRTKALKTWSYLINKGIKRKPTEYEIVSVNLHYRTDDAAAPFELDPNIPMNRWYRKYVNESPLTHDDWDDFRDPDQIIYRTYNAIQDGQEEYVDGLLNEYNTIGHDTQLSREWVGVLARLYTPGRYLMHMVQMGSAYLLSVAPASTITNCLILEGGDSMRWMQRIAYRTAELAKSWPDQKFGEGERRLWEQDAAWQGFRELMEKALVAYDWGEGFTALNLVAKPAIDEAFLRQFAAAARREGDTLLAMLNDAALVDSERHRRWSKALAEFALKRSSNKGVFESWLKTWVPLGDQAIEAFCAALPDSPKAAAEAKSAARSWRATLGFAL